MKICAQIKSIDSVPRNHFSLTLTQRGSWSSHNQFFLALQLGRGWERRHIQAFLRNRNHLLVLLFWWKASVGI